MSHPKSLKKEESVMVIVDAQTKLFSIMKYRDEVVRNIIKLIHGCQIFNIPILVTEQYPKSLGNTVSEISKALGKSAKTIEKMAFSCWKEPEFAKALKATGKKKVILVGIETHVCVYQTAMDLLAEGYDVAILLDCIASRHGYNYKAGVERMEKMGVDVYTVEIALFELLERSDIPEFKEISRLIR